MIDDYDNAHVWLFLRGKGGGIGFGDIGLCVEPRPHQAVVHACKDPCHRRAVGYTGRGCPPEHPHYLYLEAGPHLYLNMIDPPVPLFRQEMFDAYLSFVDRKQAEDRFVLVHCNRGDSRAPSLALLWLAKRAYKIDGSSYKAAAVDFGKRFKGYAPGDGIATWLTEHWDDVR